MLTSEESSLVTLIKLTSFSFAWILSMRGSANTRKSRPP